MMQIVIITHFNNRYCHFLQRKHTALQSHKTVHERVLTELEIEIEKETIHDIIKSIYFLLLRFCDDDDDENRMRIIEFLLILSFFEHSLKSIAKIVGALFC